MRRSKLNFASIVLSDVLRSGYNYCRELVIHKTITQLLHKNAVELSHSILTWFQVLSRQPFSFLCYTVTGHFYNWAMSPLSFLSTFTFWLEPGWRTGDYCDTISTLCLTSPGSGVCTVSDRWMAPQIPGDNSRHRDLSSREWKPLPSGEWKQLPPCRISRHAGHGLWTQQTQEMCIFTGDTAVYAGLYRAVQSCTNHVALYTRQQWLKF